MSSLSMGISPGPRDTRGRRDRLLFLAALAYALLVLLGAAGERCGLDRTLKASTTKRRTLSLYKQGCHWYDAISRDDRRTLRPAHERLRRVPTRTRRHSSRFWPAVTDQNGGTLQARHHTAARSALLAAAVLDAIPCTAIQLSEPSAVPRRLMQWHVCRDVRA